MIENYVCKEEHTLVQVLGFMLPGIGKGRIDRLIKDGEVKVNGVRTKKNARLSVGDAVDVYVPLNFVSTPEIIFEDENILVIDKPILTETLSLERVFADRGYVKAVHRLDKNTTGLNVFAKNPVAEKELITSFKLKHVTKIYETRVVGKANLGGVYTAYLEKHDGISNIYPTAAPGRMRIDTEFKTVKTGEISIVNARLITGKTHQIRAHLAFLGFPVLGDGKYGNGETNRKYGEKFQNLRCMRLKFEGLSGKVSYLNGRVFELPPKYID